MRYFALPPRARSPENSSYNSSSTKTSKRASNFFMSAIKRSCWQQNFAAFEWFFKDEMLAVFYCNEAMTTFCPFFRTFSSCSSVTERKAQAINLLFATQTINWLAKTDKGKGNFLIRVEHRPEREDWKIDYYRRLNRRWLETTHWKKRLRFAFVLENIGKTFSYAFIRHIVNQSGPSLQRNFLLKASNLPAFGFIHVEIIDKEEIFAQAKPLKTHINSLSNSRPMVWKVHSKSNCRLMLKFIWCCENDVTSEFFSVSLVKCRYELNSTLRQFIIEWFVEVFSSQITIIQMH